MLLIFYIGLLLHLNIQNYYRLSKKSDRGFLESNISISIDAERCTVHMRWILHRMFIWKIYVQLSRKLRSLGKKCLKQKFRGGSATVLLVINFLAFLKSFKGQLGLLKWRSYFFFTTSYSAREEKKLV